MSDKAKKPAAEKKPAAKKPKAEGAAVSKKKRPHSSRNQKLPGGVWRFGKSKMYHKRGLWKINKAVQKKEKPKRKPRTVVKPIGGEKNGGKRLVKLKKQRRYYPTEDRPKLKKSRKMIPFSKQKRYLRKRITPGTVLIMLAGPHRGKRVVFLKQLGTGLLLVTGPYKINKCPLRRVNQIYVISTTTKVDISGVKLPAHLDDKYFKRKHAKKNKKDDGEIFDTKKEEYKVSDQRKKDQIEVDKQILDSIRKSEDKKLMFGYLGSTFSLRNNMYPHKMKF